MQGAAKEPSALPEAKQGEQAAGGSREHKDALARQGKVLLGTCGWTDPTLLQCKRYYPPNVKTSVDMLNYYSKQHPCVEIDTSTYAIPRESAVKQWISAVPDGFVFNIKAYGLFASQAIESNALPVAFRDAVEATGKRIGKGIRLFLRDLPPTVIDGIWERYNKILTLLHGAGKLGCVLFQFNMGFRPNAKNFEYILECQRRLAHGKMVVEFRNREWFSPAWLGPELDLKVHLDSKSCAGPVLHPGDNEPDNLYKTLPFCRRHQLPIASCDDLKHELELPTAALRAQVKERIRMPIHVFITDPSVFYVRVHRREGKQRLLTPDELNDWRSILESIAPAMGGPMYVHFGTYWEDQPMINISNLFKTLPQNLQYEWKTVAKKRQLAKGLGRFFGAAGSNAGKRPMPSTSGPSSSGLPAHRASTTAVQAAKRQRIQQPKSPARAHKWQPKLVPTPPKGTREKGKPEAGQRALTSFFRAPQRNGNFWFLSMVPECNFAYKVGL